MDSTAISTGTEGTTWGGGNQPLKSSYGKMMMWFFIVSDALTFSGFLAAYGFSRFKFIDYWPIADEVFTHVPFLHGQELPMIYVAFMTFVLIMSSVTMVLAVDAGHQMKKNKVIWYMFFTIIGGAIFVGSQAWEWATFIQGDYGAVQTKGGNILQFGTYKSIEGEAIFNNERPKISAVYHNRLNINMKLQADPTIQFIINEPPRRLLNKDLKINSPYNTYLNKGLPPGPINSPGKHSLLAALFPEQNDFLFFVARGDGYHTFSTNKRDHDKAKRKFQKIRRKLKRKSKKQ